MLEGSGHFIHTKKPTTDIYTLKVLISKNALPYHIHRISEHDKQLLTLKLIVLPPAMLLRQQRKTLLGLGVSFPIPTLFIK